MRLPDWLSFGRKASASGDSDGYGVFLDALARHIGTKSGVAVTRDTALQVAVVFACLRVLMEGVAQVPFKVMKKGRSAVSTHPTRDDATDHPLFDLLHRRPNDWQTSFELRETMVLHAALAGNAYAYKNIVSDRGRARVAELILIDPARVRVNQAEDWSVSYEIRGKDGAWKPFPAETIWHLRGPSWSGVAGLDVMHLARDAIGLAIATESSHASLHKQGVRPSGIYTIEGSLGEGQYKQLKDWITKEYAGAHNTGVPMILDRGAKFINQSMSGVDAQHLETRGHQIEEVCRFLRVLPIMVGYSGGKTPTYASAEQMFLAHVVHTLMPWYERIQQSADVNLLTREEREAGYYTHLQEAGLLRGAMRDTSEYLHRLTQAGVMSRNEARGKLNLNPLAGLDDPLTPTNMTTDPSGAPAGDTP